MWLSLVRLDVVIDAQVVLRVFDGFQMLCMLFMILKLSISSTRFDDVPIV